MPREADILERRVQAMTDAELALVDEYHDPKWKRYKIDQQVKKRLPSPRLPDSPVAGTWGHVDPCAMAAKRSEIRRAVDDDDFWLFSAAFGVGQAGTQTYVTWMDAYRAALEEPGRLSGRPRKDAKERLEAA